MTGRLTAVVGSFAWPGDMYDRLQLVSDTDAIAARAVMGTGPSDDVVWSMSGDAVEVITALVELPAPDAPGAPRLACRAPGSLWLPRSARAS